MSGDYKKFGWFIDSGASAHLVADEKMLSNKSSSQITEIMVANKTTLPVAYSGDVDITTVVGNESHDIAVQKVLCVPGLTTILLSVSQLIKKGNSVKFDMEKCKIFNTNNQLVATANLMNGVYKLNLRAGRPEKCF